jgi:hypothetical protein
MTIRYQVVQFTFNCVTGTTSSKRVKSNVSKGEANAYAHKMNEAEDKTTDHRMVQLQLVSFVAQPFQPLPLPEIPLGNGMLVS